MSSRILPIEWQQAEIYPRPLIKGGWYRSEMERLRALIKALPPNTDVSVVESLACNQHIYLAAKQLGCRIHTAKEHGIGIRVWRVT